MQGKQLQRPLGLPLFKGPKEHWAKVSDICTSETMTVYQSFDPAELAIPQMHQLLVGGIGPRPVCFASTVDAEGRANLAPFSFFNVFSANPPVLIFSPANSGRDASPKHSYLNAKAHPEVVINIVTESMVQKMNVAAAPWDKGVSEFEMAGFTPLASEVVKPARVAESPVQYECKVIEVKELGTGGGSGNLVICQVLRVHVNRAVMTEDGRIDQTALHTVGRLGGHWYSRTGAEHMFELAQPMQNPIGYAGLPEAVKTSKELNAYEVGQLAHAMAVPSAEDSANAVKEHGPASADTIKRLLAAGKLEAAVALAWAL